MVVVDDLLQPTGNPISGAVPSSPYSWSARPRWASRLIRGRQRLLEALAEQRRQLDIQRALQARTALATERLRLAGRLHEDLVAGLDSLLTEIGVAEREGENLEAGSVAAIETQARTLLAQTRNVVVSLASESVGSATAVSNSAPTPGAPRRPPVTTRHAPPAAPPSPGRPSPRPRLHGLLLQVRARSDVHVPMPSRCSAAS